MTFASCAFAVRAPGTFQGVFNMDSAKRYPVTSPIGLLGDPSYVPCELAVVHPLAFSPPLQPALHACALARSTRSFTCILLH